MQRYQYNHIVVLIIPIIPFHSCSLTSPQGSSTLPSVSQASRPLSNGKLQTKRNRGGQRQWTSNFRSKFPGIPPTAFRAFSPRFSTSIFFLILWFKQNLLPTSFPFPFPFLRKPAFLFCSSLPNYFPILFGPLLSVSISLFFLFFSSTQAFIYTQLQE